MLPPVALQVTGGTEVLPSVDVALTLNWTVPPVNTEAGFGLRLTEVSTGAVMVTYLRTMRVLARRGGRP